MSAEMFPAADEETLAVSQHCSSDYTITLQMEIFSGPRLHPTTTGWLNPAYNPAGLDK